MGSSSPRERAVVGGSVVVAQQSEGTSLLTDGKKAGRCQCLLGCRVRCGDVKDCFTQNRARLFLTLCVPSVVGEVSPLRIEDGDRNVLASARALCCLAESRLSWCMLPHIRRRRSGQSDYMHSPRCLSYAVIPCDPQPGTRPNPSAAMPAPQLPSSAAPVFTLLISPCSNNNNNNNNQPRCPAVDAGQ